MQEHGRGQAWRGCRGRVSVILRTTRKGIKHSLGDKSEQQKDEELARACLKADLKMVPFAQLLQVTHAGGTDHEVKNQVKEEDSDQFERYVDYLHRENVRHRTNHRVLSLPDDDGPIAV